MCLNNDGIFPFKLKRDIKYLKLKAGATAHDMDSAVIEVTDITVSAQSRFELNEDGTCREDDYGRFCAWIVEFHLGEVASLHKKS